MKGPALNGTIEIGKPTSILFVARDEDGKPVVKLTEDAFQVLVDGLEDDDDEEVPVTIGRGEKLNIFTFTFTLMQAGRFRVAIWLGEKVKSPMEGSSLYRIGKLPLEGSPYTVMVGLDPLQARILQELSILRHGCYNMCITDKWKGVFGATDFAANDFRAFEPVRHPTVPENIQIYDPKFNPFVKP